MIHEVYSVKDDKVGFSSPIFDINDASVLRKFISTVQSPQQNFCNTFPEDKSLYHIGQFDDESGKLTSNAEGPRFLAHAMSHIIRPAQAPLDPVPTNTKPEGGEGVGRNDT